MTPRSAFNFLWTTGATGVWSVIGVTGQIPGKDPERFQRHTRAWARTVAAGIGLEVQAYGTWRLDPEGTYVLMANHQSHVDIPSLFLALPMVPGFLAKAELRRVPLFGRAMEVGGHVFVDRAQHGRAIEAIRAAAADVSEGTSIVVFPEGTRSSVREVLPFKKGGFLLARQAGVSIVPVGIRGTADLLPKGSKQLLPGVAEVHGGEPLDVATVTGLELPELMREVRARICELAALPPAADRSNA